MMDYYRKHLFFCTNQREVGNKKPCCNNAGATAICKYAKAKIDELGLKGPGKVRVSSSGCMGRCAQGPTLVIYPDAVWYTYQSEADIDEIIQQHILNDKIVERLLMPPLEKNS